MRKLIGVMLMLATISAMASTSIDWHTLEDRLELDPQAVLEQHRFPAASAVDETDRLLVQGFAHFHLRDQEQIEQSLTQLRQRTLNQMQKSRFGLLEGTYVGAMKSQFEQALLLYQEASLPLANLNSADALTLHIDVLLKTGSLLRYLRRPDEAIEVLSKARQRALLADDKSRVAKAEHHLGQAYRIANDPLKAAEFYRSALNASDEVNSPRFRVDLGIELTRLLRANGDYQGSLEYAHQATVNAKKANKLHLMANALSEIGYTNEAKGSISEALHYHLLALDNLFQVQSSLAIAAARHDIGRVYLTAEQPDKAMEYLLPAETVFEQRGHFRYLFLNQLRLGQAHLMLGEPMQALSLAQSLEQRVDDRIQIKEQREMWLLLADANHQLGHQEHAWSQLQTALELPQPLSPMVVGSSSQITQEQLRTQLKQAQQQDLKQQSQLQRLTLLHSIGLATSAMLFCLLLLVWHRKRRTQQRLEQACEALLTDPISQLGNRQALFQQLKHASDGALVLLHFGDLAQMELATGQFQYRQMRRAIAQRLARLEDLHLLAEPSPGQYALIVRCQNIEDKLKTLLRICAQWPESQPALASPLAVGAIGLPFQPGSMLTLPPALSLELCQFALWSAVDASHSAQDHRFVLLQPVALNAPLLKSDDLYRSAAKCVDNGVIRCISNHDDPVRLPHSATTNPMRPVTKVTNRTQLNQALP
ncbi:tetratricopeptide repeat protein [Ferrimonas pelagia]|uniref:Tetratricopeptide repeat protein n=1 Tax=Ferrimonas pelagia TaxID=1177826 RepID=A0ABP9FEY0_9GAMM